MIKIACRYSAYAKAVAFVLGLSFTTISQAGETQCADVANLDPLYNAGWGNALENTQFQKQSNITPANLSNLSWRWLHDYLAGSVVVNSQ